MFSVTNTKQPIFTKVAQKVALWSSGRLLHTRLWVRISAPDNFSHLFVAKIALLFEKSKDKLR